VPASKYTEAQRAEALKLYETEGPTAVEKQLGIPKNTVVTWAKNAGVRTIRTETTRKAVEARVADGKLRRQNITHRLYGQAEKILDDLEAPIFRTILKGEYGRDGEEELSFVPPNDRKTLLQALGTVMTTTANVEKVDAGAAAESGVNMLAALAEALGVKDD
jgi:transposase-like protein